MEQENFIKGDRVYLSGSPVEHEIVKVDPAKKTADIKTTAVPIVLKQGVPWSELRRSKDEIHSELLGRAGWNR